MKIWFDTTRSQDRGKFEYNDCSDCMPKECTDCGDCAYEDKNTYNSLAYPALLDSKEDAQHILTCIFQQSEHLYVQAYDNEKWLVCNPITSGSIAVVDQEGISLLEQFHKPITLSDILQHKRGFSASNIEYCMKLFYRLGFLQDVYHCIPYEQNYLDRTLSAWLHITNACNIRCHYCYLEKSSEHMGNSIAYRAIDTIYRSAIKHHYQNILLKYAGGEASLQQAKVLTIHDYASELAHRHGLKFHAYIMSNGVNLPQQLIDQLKTKLIGVMISLDGIGNYHDRQRPFISGKGSFRYVDRTILRLIASNLMPHINVTVSQQNLDGLPDLIEYLLEHELPFTLSYYRQNQYSSHLSDLQFNDAYMIAAMRLAFNVIERHLPQRSLIGSLIDKANMTITHEHTCSVGRSYLVIDQKGGIAKCHADIKQTITTIDADDPLQIIRDDHQGVQGLAVEDKEGCRTCQWRYWCTGGCPLLTYQVTGRSDIKSPNCNIYKALFPEALRLEGMRLLKYTSHLTL